MKMKPARLHLGFMQDDREISRRMKTNPKGFGLRNRKKGVAMNLGKCGRETDRVRLSHRSLRSLLDSWVVKTVGGQLGAWPRYLGEWSDGRYTCESILKCLSSSVQLKVKISAGLDSPKVLD